MTLPVNRHPVPALARWMAAASMAWRWLVRAHARRRRRRQQERELRGLDPAALRDLGLDRSELGSYEAEAAGAAMCTRRRVSGGPGPGGSPESLAVGRGRSFSHAGSHEDCVPSRLHFLSMETVMPKFVIERAIPGIGASTAGELRAASQKSCGVLQELGPDVQWVHSYVTGDTIYCVYLAASEDLVREHARRAGFPANRVAQVVTTIDPTTAEA